jgi:MoaA/NifB/PqqE/SkfB family radical SAM enzyme
MPSTSLFVPFPKGAAEPTAVELAAVVDACYQHGDIVGMGENDPGVVFAGAGEPLLRLDVLVDTMDLVRESRHGALFRVHSNGLHPTTTARALADAKVDRVTVALATADPRQFHALVKPSGNEHDDFSTVCGFIASLAEFGVDVEAVTVAAPNVDVAAARKLSEALGASSHRTREYFP